MRQGQGQVQGQPGEDREGKWGGRTCSRPRAPRPLPRACRRRGVPARREWGFPRCPIFGLGGAPALRIPSTGGRRGGGNHPWGSTEERLRGREKGNPSTGEHLAALGQGSPCAPGPGRGFGQAGAGRGRQHAPDSEANPPFGFSAAGRPAGQRGILAAAFPTGLSKGQAAYANDFNKYFFRRNIITEHKLGFNSRLITRGGRRVRGDGRAGRGAAAGEAPSPLRV